MDLKFYLNKIVKVDGVENYTLSTLSILRERYDSFLDNTEGLDPDFPTLSMGGKGKKGEKVKGVNRFANLEDDDSDELSRNSGNIYNL